MLLCHHKNLCFYAMAYFTQVIYLLQLQLIAALPIYGISCRSRYYCGAQEIKYISMGKLTNTFLNATAVKEQKVQNVESCQKLCVEESKCQSINFNVSKSGEYDCILLDTNRYSNASLLVARQDFTHYYIPSKCQRNPCKNGAVCVPLYTNHSYSCECKSTGIRITRGKHCEIVLAGLMSAFIYYSFNDPAKKTPISSSDSSMSTYTISWTGGSEPGRNSPVVVCDGVGASCLQIWNRLPCLCVFDNCKTTVSYSIWLKYRKKQIGRRVNLIRMTGYSRRGLSLLSNSGGYDFACSLSLTKRWKLYNFGTWVDQTKWNQLTFSIDDNSHACVYINGVKEKCQTKPDSVSYSQYSNPAIRIGGDWYYGAEPAIYFDDLAIWQVALTDDEVKSLYLASK